MTFPQKKESTKLSLLKEFFKYYGLEILIIAIYAVAIILAIVLPKHFVPTHTTQGTVTAVGYKGVTVEYKGEYGQNSTKEINVDDVTKYQIGDAVTIKISTIEVEIVGIGGEVE